MTDFQECIFIDQDKLKWIIVPEDAGIMYQKCFDSHEWKRVCLKAAEERKRKHWSKS